MEDKFYPFLSIYQKSPRWVRSSVGAAYRRIPDKVRYGSNLDHFSRLADAELEWAPEQIETYQLNQLRETVRLAQSACPYYRDLFSEHNISYLDLRSAADLQQFPTLDKETIQERAESMVNTELDSGLQLRMTTGGSTGVPVGFFLHKGVSRTKEKAFLDRLWQSAGYQKGDRVVVIRGQVTSRRSSGKVWYFDATRNWLMLSANHLTPERLPEYLHKIRKFQPTFLHAYPSAAVMLANCLKTREESLGIPIKAILCSSERLEPNQQVFVEKMFGAPVLSWYGHAERVVLASKLPGSPAYHFSPAYGFVEFEPSGNDGMHEVVGTSFHNRVMPFIRYRTGDYVQLIDENQGTSPGSSPWPAVSSIAGRRQEFLVSASGRRISLTAFNMHDSTFDDLTAVQFYQSQPGVATFRYVSSKNLGRTRRVALQKRIRSKIGEDFDLQIQKVDHLQRSAGGKHQWLISELD